MECENHPGVEATARCTRCGRYLCSSCVRRVDGRIYCDNCVASCPADDENVLVRVEDLQIARAFTFLVEDPRWWLKMLIGALFMLASVLVVPYFFVLGYQVALIRAVAAGQDGSLPEWDDLGLKFKDGASIFLIGLVYALPMLIVMAAVVVLGVLVGAPSNSTAHGLALGIAVIGFAVGWLLVVAYGLVLRLVSPAIIGIFARTGSIRDALQPGAVFGLVRCDVKAYLLVFLMTAFVTSTIAFLGVLACCIGLLVTTFYAVVVNGHLIGQLTRFNPVGENLHVQ
ncbi:MAG: DUF4013 domain-containing protein [Candidatus Geothermincolia bacterium]